MRKILVLVYLVLQSCGTFEMISYNTPSIKSKNESYGKYNYNYWDSWEYNYNRFYYPYYSIPYYRNRVIYVTPPVYKSLIRARVKTRTYTPRSRRPRVIYPRSRGGRSR